MTDHGGTEQSKPAVGDAVVEELDEPASVALIASGGVGRLAYSGRFGLVILPVNYQWYEGTVVFRTAQDSPMEEDLRTGIEYAEYKVAFEIDEVDMAAREGWSVLIQGSAHHVDSPAERAEVATTELDVWPGGDREMFIRIIPTHVTGRRIHRIR